MDTIKCYSEILVNLNDWRKGMVIGFIFSSFMGLLQGLDQHDFVAVKEAALVRLTMLMASFFLFLSLTTSS